MFTENLEPETVMPFLEPLMTRLVQMLQTPKKGVKASGKWDGRVDRKRWFLYFPETVLVCFPETFDITYAVAQGCTVGQYI